MSQLFGMNEDNNIGIRVNDIKANNVYQKNEITGLYERVSGGGGIPVLPYYLKNNTIDIDSGSNGSELSATGLTLGDAIGNETLDKTKIKILSNLKTDVMDPALGLNIGPFVVGFNKGLNLFQRISSFKLGNNTTNVEYTNLNVIVSNGTEKVNLLPDSLTIVDSNGSEIITKDKFKILSDIKTNIITPDKGTHYSGRYLVSYNKNTDVFERASEFFFGDININSYVGLNVHSLKNGNNNGSLNSVFLTFTTSSGSSSINYNHLVILNNLYNPALISPTASNKMLVFNPTTKIYNYANIPVGSTLPKLSYKIVNGDEFLSCDLGETTDSISFLQIDPKPVSTFTNIMVTGEKMILDFTKGGTVYYPAKTYTWYNIKLNPVSSFNSRFIFNVTPDIGKITGGDYASKDYDVYVRKLPKSITYDGSTMDVNSYLFKIVDKFAGNSTPQLFAGSLIVECVTTDYTSGVSL